MKRTTSQLELRQQLTKDVWRQIIKLDNLEKFEESYALTQEWREWLLDPQINNNFYMNCQAINTSCLSCEKRSKIIVDLRVEQPFAPLLG